MNIREFSEKSIRNRTSIESASICGCYFCISIFDSKDIKDWIDNGQTALCPLCRVDAIIPEVDISITKEYLQKINNIGFGEEKIRKHGQTMGKISIIGDTHGKYDHYHKIVRQSDHPYTVQIGDFGFRYDTVKNLDPACHKILGGNHDNYQKIIDIPHYLGDYGYTTLNGVGFFFYRGAYSIDRQHRTIGIDWWENEQLSIEDFMKARELYRELKPDIVLTHDCPESINYHLLPVGAHRYQNTTGWALDELFRIHQPKIWRFGHYHRKWSMTIGCTNFRCLDELEVEILEI